MNLRVNLSIQDIKVNWRKHVYTLAGIAIVGFLVFMTFRSFAFLGGQLSAIFQFDTFSQGLRPGFDTENFEKIKDRL